MNRIDDRIDDSPTVGESSCHSELLQAMWAKLSLQFFREDQIPRIPKQDYLEGRVRIPNPTHLDWLGTGFYTFKYVWDNKNWDSEI